MSSLLTAHQLSKAFGTDPLFEDLSFSLHQGDRIGLIGPNGCGKSTLLKILMGIESPDEGHLSKRQGLVIGYANQAPDFEAISAEQVLIQACPHGDPHEIETRARTLLSRAQFPDANWQANTLSGGWKKRLDICRAMMNEPTLLLLDEPTNHLDLEGILWLEKFLLREPLTTLIVSHDRYFLKRVSTSIMEINRCYPEGLFHVEGDIDHFFEHKLQFMQGQLEKQRSLAGIVKEEVEWLRRSPKARTCKSTARVQKAHELQESLQEVRRQNTTHKVHIEFSASERQTRNLLVGTNLSKTLGNRLLFKNIDLKLSPGTRLGIVGKNATGKTTLLKILANEIPHDTGTLKYADDLQLVYFDQHREQIPPHMTIREALSPQGDMVNYRGQSIHVNGWAKRFLFSSERLDLQVKYLSGGERARIQIARLMLKPADILFLDEPTNDLDIATLEVIEESLLDFPGAVVLISHDRCLMDKICTQILALGEDLPQRFFADYSQWELALSQLSSPAKAQAVIKEPATVTPKSPQKLNNKEKRELDSMESSITLLEKQIEETEQKIAALPPESAETRKLYQELGSMQEKLETCFIRWQELLDKSKS